jgi:hypothetical protein
MPPHSARSPSVTRSAGGKYSSPPVVVTVRAIAASARSVTGQPPSHSGSSPASQALAVGAGRPRPAVAADSHDLAAGPAGRYPDVRDGRPPLR